MRKNTRDLTVLKDDLPDRGRPNVKGNEAYAVLVRWVKKDGLLTPVFIDKAGVVVSGHYRFWAAQDAGHKAIPVEVVSGHREALERMESLARR